jgi:hypothetical protein
MSDRMLDRRALLKGVVLGAAALPAMGLASDAFAAAVPLDANDPQAKALGYNANTASVDNAKYPAHKADAKCARCVQYQGKAGDATGPCTIFAGKLVAKDGWCSVYALKPGA